jgi:hypothetical protein
MSRHGPEKIPDWPLAEEKQAMTNGSGYFVFESIIYLALTTLVIATLTMFGHAATHLAVVA